MLTVNSVLNRSSGFLFFFWFSKLPFSSKKNMFVFLSLLQPYKFIHSIQIKLNRISSKSLFISVIQLKNILYILNVYLTYI